MRTYRRMAVALSSLLASFIVVCTVDARGTTLTRMSVEGMTSVAGYVVLGTCLWVESHWTEDGKQILTYITLTNTQSLKGNIQGDVTFVQLGGRVGNQVMKIVGAPTFELGEEMIVFLTEMPSSTRLVYSTDLWLLGLEQGKWKIVRDPTTKTAIATVTTGAARIIDSPAQRADTRLLLADLIARIRAAVKR